MSHESLLLLLLLLFILFLTGIDATTVCTGIYQMIDYITVCSEIFLRSCTDGDVS